jgi:hypothetical protein
MAEADMAGCWLAVCSPSDARGKWQTVTGFAAVRVTAMASMRAGWKRRGSGRRRGRGFKAEGEGDAVGDYCHAWPFLWVALGKNPVCKEGPPKNKAGHEHNTISRAAW